MPRRRAAVPDLIGVRASSSSEHRSRGRGTFCRCKLRYSEGATARSRRREISRLPVSGAAVATRPRGGRCAAGGWQHGHRQGFSGSPHCAPRRRYWRHRRGRARGGTDSCPAPAPAQIDIARLLAPHLADGQIVFLPPGSFGSVLFAKAARDADNRADAAFAETGTLPWLTRKHAPFEVAITMRAKRLPTGVFPVTRKDRALTVLRNVFPNVIEDCGDALSAALMNAGPIIHPPLIVMNAGAAAAFRPLGHPQGGNAAGDPAASPTGSMPNGSPCAKRSATARRIFRSPIIMPRTARNGCTAEARMTGSPIPATGANTSC